MAACSKRDVSKPRIKHTSPGRDSLGNGQPWGVRWKRGRRLQVPGRERRPCSELGAHPDVLAGLINWSRDVSRAGDEVKAGSATGGQAFDVLDEEAITTEPKRRRARRDSSRRQGHQAGSMVGLNRSRGKRLANWDNPEPMRV